MDCELDTTWNEAAMVHSNVLSRHFPGRIEENHRGARFEAGSSRIEVRNISASVNLLSVTLCGLAQL
jgi:hypothetical protein